MPDKHAEGQVPESKQNAAPKMADFSDAFYKTRETSGMTEQNRADVNCVSQICIQISDSDFEALHAALDNPPEPNEALKALLRKPRKDFVWNGNQ